MVDLCFNFVSRQEDVAHARIKLGVIVRWNWRTLRVDLGSQKQALDATFQRAFSARRLRACRVFDRHPSPQHGNCIDNCKDESRGCYQDLQEGDARYLRHGRVTFRWVFRLKTAKRNKTSSYSWLWDRGTITSNMYCLHSAECRWNPADLTRLGVWAQWMYFTKLKTRCFLEFFWCLVFLFVFFVIITFENASKNNLFCTMMIFSQKYLNMHSSANCWLLVELIVINV